MVREPASDAPTAAIVASGEELIAGRRTDTNSTLLQRRLRALGVAVLESRQIGDGMDRAIEQFLIQRFDLFPVGDIEVRGHILAF